MFGNGLDLTVSEVVFTKCLGGCGGIHPGWFTCLPGFCLPCRVLVIMPLLAVRGDEDGRDSHLATRTVVIPT